MKKIVPIILVALMASALAVSCKKGGAQASKSGQTVIRWAFWGSETRIKLTNDAIALYESQNPNVKINIEPSGGTGDHFQKVNTQLAGGAAPDIFQVGGNLEADYTKNNTLIDLTPYVGKELDLSKVDPGVKELGTFGGKLFGISTGTTMPALLINKTLIEKSGVPLPNFSMSYDEFRAYLVRLKAALPAGVYPIQDIGSQSSNSTPFGYWARYNGTPFANAENNATEMTVQAAQKYFELWKDYRDSGLCPPAAEAASYAETSADTSMLIAGKCAISFVWSNSFGGYQATTKDELDLIEFPGAAANKSLWPAPSQFWTVTRDSKNAAEAIKFVNWMLNSPDAAKILGMDRGFSASSSYRAGATLDDNQKKIAAYLDQAAPHSSAETPHVPNDTELNSTLYKIYQEVAFGRSTPAKGAQDLINLLNSLFKK